MSLILTLFSLQDFSFKETEFDFCLILSNFLKYSFSNFSSSHPYNIFTVYLSGDSPLLKTFSSVISKFSYSLLTSMLILSLNLSTVFFVFSKSFSHSYISFSAINLLQYTKYFTISYIFVLFNLFFICHSLTPTLWLSLLLSVFHLPLSVL